MVKDNKLLCSYLCK